MPTTFAQLIAAIQAYVNTYIYANNSGKITGPVMNTVIVTVATMVATFFYTYYTPLSNDPINAGQYSTVSAAEAAAISASKALSIPAGSYDASSVTFSTPVIFQPGATLSCASAQYSFTNTVTAPRNAIFASGCTPNFAGDYRQSEVYPEWWGGAGDSNGASGSGTDNTTPITNAIASGAGVIAFAPRAIYRFTSISTTSSNFKLSCPGHLLTQLVQDDTTLTADAIFLHGHSGQQTISGCNIFRVQAAVGTIASAEVVAGGTSCPAGTTLTMGSGTYTTAGVLTVTSATGGVATGVGVTTGGSYTKRPPPTQTLTTGIPAVAPSAASGGCTGLTVKLAMQGPAIIHSTDGYYQWFQDNLIGGTNAWHAVVIDQASNNPSSIYIERNQIPGGEDSAIFANGTTSPGIGDLFIDQSNYISGWGFAGVEEYGYVGGTYEQQNVIYNNKYANYWDNDTATNGISSTKIRDNDIDTNNSGSYFYKVGTLEYENNWGANPGNIVCTLCASSDFKGGIYPSTGGLVFNGSQGIVIDTLFGPQAAPITLNSYNGTSNVGFSIDALWPYGSGYFLTVNDAAASYFSVKVELNPSVQFLTGNTIAHFTSLVPDASNQNNSPTCFVFGQSNGCYQNDSVAFGYANNNVGYASAAIGQYNNIAGGAYSSARGIFADTNSVNGIDVWSSGRFSVVGDQSGGRIILSASTSATTATELSVNAAGASAANIVAMPNSSAYSVSGKVTGYDETASGAVECYLTHALVTRGASASTVAVASGSGTFTCGGATGTLASITTPTLYADTTYGGFSAQVTPPSTHTIHWTADLSFDRIQ